MSSQKTPSQANPPRFPEPEDAEAAFYDALKKGDVDALMQVFSEEEEVVCAHPNGKVCVGLHAIRTSFQEIFEHNASFLVAVPRRVVWHSTLLTVHQVHEILSFHDKEESELHFLVSYIFSRGANGWRIVSRQASLLKEILGAPQTEARVLH